MFTIRPLTADLVQGALEVLRESFFPDEKICIAVGILRDSKEIQLDERYKCTVASKELEDLAADTVQDQVSLVVVDANEDVVGVAFNKLQTIPPDGELSYFEKFTKEHIQDPSALALVDYMVQVDSRLSIFGLFNIDCIMEIMFLAVKSTHKGCGVGTMLVSGSADLAERIKDNPIPGKPIPKAISAIFTSKGSQKCGEKSGFEHLLKIPYTKFVYKGETYDKAIGPEHPFCTLSAKKFS